MPIVERSIAAYSVCDVYNVKACIDYTTRTIEIEFVQGTFVLDFYTRPTKN